MRTQHGEQPNDEIRLHWLLLGELLTWIGSSFIWPLTSVYLNKQLHVSLAMIGIVLLFNCLANMLGSFVAGWSYDRFNPYYLIIAGGILDAIVLFGMAANHTWPIYWLWMTLTGFLGGWNGALINSIATSLKSKQGRYVFNMIYFAQNLGVVIGTLVVGYLYDYSVTVLFVVAGMLFLIVCINAIFNYRPIIQFHKERQQEKNTGEVTNFEPMPAANLKLSIGFFVTLAVIWLMYMNWESNLSVYMVSLGIPFHLYSLLWTINAGIIVVVQAILGRFPNIFKTLFHQVIFGVVMFAISFITLIFAKDYPHFVFSMVTLTLGESTAMPAMPAYVNDLSPESSKGKYQGLTLSMSSIGRAFGPLFGGLIIDRLGYINFFIAAAAGIFLMIVVLVPLHARLKRKVKLFK
ncbi:MFS family permease [Lactobacillus colini]|uniref:MFS family permease n=1 Tax=Lactobacillus colini TaxID=1819254 RepID=A0ABS4MCM0_9LACO|nr:MFS transporter [Lactobacillus colini]MBP2057432.1 MFS family permease [Lactobacillus colini]